MILRSTRKKFFELYIARILSEISSDHPISITLNAKQQLNSVAIFCSRTIAEHAFSLCKISEKKTLSVKELENALKILFPKKCIDYLDFASKTLKIFHTLETTPETNELLINLKKPRQKKAGLIVPPSIAERFLRNNGYWNIKITRETPVFLASIIEKILRDTLLSAIEECKSQEQLRIGIRHFEMVLAGSEIMKMTKCKLTGGGVPQKIHESLCVKSKRVRRNLILPNLAPKRRFRAGTVSIREIKRLQKTSNSLIFAKLPFERVVRQKIQELFSVSQQGLEISLPSFEEKNPLKVSKKFLIVLQYHIEQYVVKILQNSNLITNHSKHIKVGLSDIKVALKIMDIDVETI